MSNSIHVVCPACGSVNSLPAERIREKPKCGKCKGLLFDGRPMQLTSETFGKYILRSGLPVVVDFWAAWCGPCKMMAPAFAQAASQLQPMVLFAKVNTENEQEIAGQYRIMSIPTLVIFRGGREIARQSGALDSNRLIAWIQANI